VRRVPTATALLAAVVMTAACGRQPPSPPPPSAAPKINLADIEAVRSALPADYEIGDLDGPVSAASLWGFGTGWTADPPQCAALADPAPTDSDARGISASGPGGTVFILAADAAGGPPDAAGGCDAWTMRYGHTTAEVTRSAPPDVEDSRTLAWRAVARTVVESGSATLTDAATMIAYLDAHVVVVIVVTDPGSTHPPLDSSFADGLLAAAVTALRVH
jgi:hypothetical protein